MKIFAKGIVGDTITLKAGADVLKVSYRFNATANWQEVNRLRVLMYNESQRKNPDTEKIGKYLLDLLVLVFGKDCGDQMLAFFDGSLESMIESIAPVFKYYIYPACMKARKRAIKDRKARK